MADESTRTVLQTPADYCYHQPIHRVPVGDDLIVLLLDPPLSAAKRLQAAGDDLDAQAAVFADLIVNEDRRPVFPSGAVAADGLGLSVLLALADYMGELGETPAKN